MQKWSVYGSTTVTIEDVDYKVSVIGSFSKFIDGQDADGNRGWEVTSYDGLDIDEISPTPPTAEIKEAIEDEAFDRDADDFNWEEEYEN